MLTDLSDSITEETKGKSLVYILSTLSEYDNTSLIHIFVYTNYQ